MKPNQVAPINRIMIFPIKSLDGHSLERVDVLQNGALKDDRRWALIDDQGKILNAKRTARFHVLRTEYSPDLTEISLSTVDNSQSCINTKLDPHNHELLKWFSDFFELKVGMMEDRHGGFPDDRSACGLTLISNQTLITVGTWFGIDDPDELRRRFRTNIEIDVPIPFWEEYLLNSPDVPGIFHLGNLKFQAINPCQRCAVPARNSLTGEMTPQFQKQFATHRKNSLPGWSPKLFFNHYYRLAINTKLASDSDGGFLKLGDHLTMTD